MFWVESLDKRPSLRSVLRVRMRFMSFSASEGAYVALVWYVLYDVPWAVSFLTVGILYHFVGLQHGSRVLRDVYVPTMLTLKGGLSSQRTFLHNDKSVYDWYVLNMELILSVSFRTLRLFSSKRFLLLLSRLDGNILGHMSCDFFSFPLRYVAYSFTTQSTVSGDAVGIFVPAGFDPLPRWMIPIRS